MWRNHKNLGMPNGERGIVLGKWTIWIYARVCSHTRVWCLKRASYTLELEPQVVVRPRSGEDDKWVAYLWS